MNVVVAGNTHLFMADVTHLVPDTLLMYVGVLSEHTRLDKR